MEWDGGSRVQTYLSILCFDAQFSRKGSAGFRFAASQVDEKRGSVNSIVWRRHESSHAWSKQLVLHTEIVLFPMIRGVLTRTPVTS